MNESRAGDDYGRAQIQLKGHPISQEQFDQMRTALESARAEHQIALAKVQAARTATALFEETKLRHLPIGTKMDMSVVVTVVNPK